MPCHSISFPQFLDLVSGDQVLSMSISFLFPIIFSKTNILNEAYLFSSHMKSVAKDGKWLSEMRIF